MLFILFPLLLFIALDDIRHLRVRNWASALLAATGGLDAALSGRLADGLAGGVLGYGLIFVAAVWYHHWRGKEGIGMGDAKLLGAGGVWTGVLEIPFALLVASVCALLAVWLLPARLAIGSRSGKIPFAPFLCAGILAGWTGIGKTLVLS